MSGAEVFARGIIAAATAYGDDPVRAFECRTGILRRSLLPSVAGISAATGMSIERVGRIIGVKTSAFGDRQRAGGVRFERAAQAAQDAVAYHLKGKRLAWFGVQSIHPEKTERALPKGARLKNLGDGVQMIVRAPIPARVINAAIRYMHKGTPMAAVAEAFDVDEADLTKAVQEALS